MHGDAADEADDERTDQRAEDPAQHAERHLRGERLGRGQTDRRFRPRVRCTDERQAERDRDQRNERAPVAAPARPCDDCVDQRGKNARDHGAAEEQLHQRETSCTFGFRAHPGLRNEDVASAADDLVAGDRDDESRLAARPDGKLGIGERERPVGARRQHALVGADIDEARRVAMEHAFDRLHRERMRVVAREPRAGTLLGQRVHDLAQRAVAVDRHAPLLGALDDVAAESCVAHLPQRRREHVAHDGSIRVAPGLGEDETVLRPQPRVVAREHDVGEALPRCVERSAVLAQRGIGRRLRVGTADRDTGHVGAKRRCSQPGDEAGHREPGQCALERRDPRWILRVRRLRGRRFGGRLLGAAPAAVAQERRQLRERTRAHPAHGDDRERHQRSGDDERLLHARLRRIDEEYRNREQREVEHRVQQHRREQAEAQEDQRPDRRRHEQLDQPRIVRKPGIVRVRGAEHECLHDDGDRDRERAPAEARADQRGDRERHRTEQALLHEAGLQRDRDRRQRRHRAAEHVRVGQRLGWLPPAEPAIRRVVERRDERELDRHEQVAAERAADHLPCRRGFARPQPP